MPDGSKHTALIKYLEAHQGSAKYLVAVVSSNEADAIILATNKPVMALSSCTNSRQRRENLDGCSPYNDGAPSPQACRGRSAASPCNGCQLANLCGDRYALDRQKLLV